AMAKDEESQGGGGGGRYYDTRRKLAAQPPPAPAKMNRALESLGYVGHSPTQKGNTDSTLWFDVRNAQSNTAAGFFAGGGVQEAAATRAAGELFEYKIETPVNLKRQRSAMLPIVTKEIEGT